MKQLRTQQRLEFANTRNAALLSHKLYKLKGREEQTYFFLLEKKKKRKTKAHVIHINILKTMQICILTHTYMFDLNTGNKKTRDSTQLSVHG